MGTAAPAPGPAPGDPLAAIRRRFLALADGYAVELEILLEDAADPAQTAEALREIGAIAHRVAGVAATLGFGPLGEIALRLDRQLGAGRPDGPPLLAPHAPLIGQFHAALESLLDRRPR